MAGRVSEEHWIIPDVHVHVDIAPRESDRILADEAAQLRVVVPRPRVAPTASLARKSTSSPMRRSPMRAGRSEDGRAPARPKATQVQRRGSGK